MDKKGYSMYLLSSFVIIIFTIHRTAALRENKDLKQQRQQQQQPKQHHAPANTTSQAINFTSGKLDWEGGSFPYEETQDEAKDETAFYKKAVLVAPIVGSIFMISLVIAGVYALRQYEVPECNRGKDVEHMCNNCSRLRKQGLHNKLHNYVMRLFDISANKHEAFFVQMDPKSRTLEAKGSSRGTNSARETLV